VQTTRNPAKHDPPKRASRNHAKETSTIPGCNQKTYATDALFLQENPSEQIFEIYKTEAYTKVVFPEGNILAYLGEKGSERQDDLIVQLVKFGEKIEEERQVEWIRTAYRVDARIRELIDKVKKIYGFASKEKDFSLLKKLPRTVLGIEEAEKKICKVFREMCIKRLMEDR